MVKNKSVVISIDSKAKKEAPQKKLVSVQTSLSFCFDILDALNQDGFFDEPENSGLYGIYAQGNKGYVKVPATVSLEYLHTLKTEISLQVSVEDEETKISFVL